MVKPKCVFLLDMSRNRSHLFFRFLSTHPDIEPLWHPFLPAHTFGPERITQHTKVAEEAPQEHDTNWDFVQSTETYAEASDKISLAAERAAKENRIFVANEHCQMVVRQEIVLPLIRNQPQEIPDLSNPTYIPDNIFYSLTPIFIIRHPIFAVPSNYESFLAMSRIRPGEEQWTLPTSLANQRYLFDFFIKRDGKAPLVVDGDDVLWRTDEVRKGVCGALGIRAEGMKDQWEPVPAESRANDSLVRHFMQVSDDSTGILRGKEGRPVADLKKAVNQWMEKYGEIVAGQLKETVEGNMEHYKHMNAYKI